MLSCAVQGLDLKVADWISVEYSYQARLLLPICPPACMVENVFCVSIDQQNLEDNMRRYLLTVHFAVIILALLVPSLAAAQGTPEAEPLPKSDAL